VALRQHSLRSFGDLCRHHGRRGPARCSGRVARAGAARDGRDCIEARGYDGTAGSWLIYILEVDGSSPLTCRWSDNLVRGNQWQARQVPIAFEWQGLSHGVEVRFSKRDWQPGEFICLTARDQLVTVIYRIEGNALILKDAANRTVSDAVVRHTDRVALQAAIVRAVRERRNLFVPAGYYRLTGGTGLAVRDANGITIEGASGAASARRGERARCNL
jgi:hypothetical protein